MCPSPSIERLNAARETTYLVKFQLPSVSPTLVERDLSVCLFTLSFIRVLPLRLATPRKECLCQHSYSCCSVLRVLKKLFKTRQTNKRNVELEKEVGTRRANRNCHFEGNRRTSWRTDRHIMQEMDAWRKTRFQSLECNYLDFGSPCLSWPPGGWLVLNEWLRGNFFSSISRSVGQLVLGKVLRPGYLFSSSYSSTVHISFNPSLSLINHSR